MKKKKEEIDKPNHVTKVIVIRAWVATTTNDEDGIKRRYSVLHQIISLFGCDSAHIYKPDLVLFKADMAAMVLLYFFGNVNIINKTAEAKASKKNQDLFLLDIPTTSWFTVKPLWRQQ